MAFYINIESREQPPRGFTVEVASAGEVDLTARRHLEGLPFGSKATAIEGERDGDVIRGVARGTWIRTLGGTTRMDVG